MYRHSLRLGAGCAALLFAFSATAAITHSTQHSTAVNGLDAQIAANDIIAGMIGTELPGDLGWHPANSNPADQLPALTDGAGLLGSGLTGLLNDFPGVGTPAKLIRYDFAAADLAEIRILSGNAGRDGRVFSTTVIRYSNNDGQSWDLLGYFQSDPSGTLNSGGGNNWASTLVTIYDDASPTLLAGATNLIFELYAVDNTGGQMRDPFDGVNPFTGVDDGLTAAFVSPLIWEIDVVEVPEPAGLLLLTLVGALAIRRR
ncbi:MAG: PEP-CTERM sorting domain-containing protein [Phycisphaerales bacterium]|nr:PEP-CTERM sorting domain-containing protein [Phycisphaerales bacterium]